MSERRRSPAKMRTRYSELHRQEKRIRAYRDRFYLDNCTVGDSVRSLSGKSYTLDKSSPAYIPWMRLLAASWYRLWQAERAMRFAYYAPASISKLERQYCNHFHGIRRELAELGHLIPKGPFKRAKRTKAHAA